MDDRRPLFLVGGGGHAKVVISAARAAGRDVIGVADDDERLWGSAILGVRIVGGLDTIPSDAEVLVAVGENPIRERVVRRVTNPFGVVAHPASVIDPSVCIGRGSVVFAGAVIQPDTVIGEHTIVNTGATIDHDCRVGRFVHIAPGVHLAGDVHVGHGSFLGIGAVAIPGVRIGDRAVVGAGGVVTEDLPGDSVAVGAPARVIAHTGE